ncbi:alpha/beta hydrolase, partial [Planktothrix mougeotii]
PLGRAWYALETPEYKGLTETQNQVKEWVESLEASTGVPLSKTILGGFSQGGAMALDVGRYFPLAGLISLSGYLHFSPEPLDHPLSAVLIVHGKQDPVVPIEAAQQARNVFQQLGAQVEYQEFNMGHEIRPEVLGLIRSFVMNCMP